MKQVDLLMAHAVREQVFPGGVLLVSEKGRTIFHNAYGTANMHSGSPVTTRTVFDLASLTKPLATTPAVMKLMNEKKLDVSDVLGRHLPASQGTPLEKTSIRQLLNHTSGLPDYRPFYKDIIGLPATQRRNALKKRVLSEPLVHAPGTETVYSDLGFMILGWVVESVSGQRLHSFLERSVYGPAGFDNLFFIALHGPDGASDFSDITFAATEECPWRGKMIEGAVHDDNAWAAGGVEGHAGLFGTAEAVHTLLSDLLATYHGQPGTGMFNRETLRLFLKRPDTGHARVMGFDVPESRGSSSGSCFSTDTVGHLGFTGTSFWMDLQRSITVILLTNRIHPSRENEKIKAFRPKLHDAVMQRLGRS